MAVEAGARLAGHRPTASLVRDAYRAGERQGMFDALKEHIRDPGTLLRAEAAIQAAPTVEAARAECEAILKSRVDTIKYEQTDHNRKLRLLERQLGAAEEILEWTAHPLTLGAIDESALHNALEPLLFTLGDDPMPDEILAARTSCEVFLVQHDWASVLSGAEVDDGGYRLPFDLCCFEFAISGHRVCALIASEDGEPYRLTPIIRTKFGWIVMKSYSLAGGVTTPEWVDDGTAKPEGDEVIALIMAQVRAIAITLDAEVVTSTPVRAPHRLNVQRLKRNATPIYDHHTLSLSRRARLEPLQSEPTGHRKRLHFRRGHWRHYPAHKTWIRWCLVGDPSLGFADKDYRI